MIFLTKNMKKLIVIAAALLIGLQANAQIIFNGGYLHATDNITQTTPNGEIKGTNLLDGFYAGAKYRIGLDGITEGLSLAPGANVSVLFGRDAGLPDCLDDAKTTEVAVNVPLHVQYLFEITPDFKLEAWAGPTVQFGVYNRTIDGETNPTNIYNLYKEIPTSANNLGASIAPRNRFNLFLGLGVGFEVAELVHVNVGYDFGVLNLATNPNEKIYRGLLRVGVGYNF